MCLYVTTANRRHFSVKLSQSLSLRDHCFLARPEWQELLQTTEVEIPHAPNPDIRSSLRARGSLMAHLVHLPTLMSKTERFTKLLRQDDHNMWTKEVLRVQFQSEIAQRRKAINQWIVQETQPRLHPSFAVETTEWPEAAPLYPDLLLAVLDCAAQTAMLTLDNMSRGLQPELSDVTMDFVNRQAQRRKRIINAFKFVKANSALAAKPLECGIVQAGVLLTEGDV